MDHDRLAYGVALKNPVLATRVVSSGRSRPWGAAVLQRFLILWPVCSVWVYLMLQLTGGD
jgi:hypothetical protein